MASKDCKEKPKSKLPELFQLVDKHAEKFTNNLKEAVSIPSRSADSNHRKDVLKMVNCIQKYFYH